MAKWKKCLLGDVITFQRGYDLPKTKMKGGKYPVVGSNGIIGWHDDYTTDIPGITVGRSGNVGKPFMLNRKSWSHNTTLFIKEYRGVLPQFIYYFLQTLDLENYAGGSAVPTLNRNHIHKLEVYIPSELETQVKITNILETLDSKIKLNIKINDNLAYVIGLLKLKQYQLVKTCSLKNQYQRCIIKQMPDSPRPKSREHGMAA